MPKCTRKGCGKEYDEKENMETSCHYHSGGPIFHEGLKSWSCCQDINRPVLDFESFMAIQGCTVSSHTSEKPKVEAPTSGGVSTITTAKTGKIEVKPQVSQTDANGKETFTTTMPTATIMNSPSQQPAKPAAPPPEEEDDPSISVPEGIPCKHRGCNAKFVSNEVSREEGEGSVCTYHPSQPIFHEGSKGYLCCKRRVLEFDEFLKIPGCKTGKHLFAPKQTEKPSEEIVNCRIDHYQTPSQVHVSVFAKQTDKEASKISFEETKIHLDLLMPSNKRFRKSLDLYGPIKPSESRFTYFGTKVELVLSKADTRSWLLLEATDKPTGPYSLTFGVSGRTGTIGGKELILSEENKLRTG